MYDMPRALVVIPLTTSLLNENELLTIAFNFWALSGLSRALANVSGKVNANPPPCLSFDIIALSISISWILPWQQ